MKGYLKRYWACPWFPCLFLLINFLPSQIFIIRFNFKQLLDEVFVISGIIKVEVSVISRSRRLRLITLTETLIIPDITKTESNNCFIIHCFEENNDKRIITAITVYFQTLTNVQLSDKQIFTVFIKQSSALGNHALRAQPTDYSVICRNRLVNNR